MIQKIKTDNQLTPENAIDKNLVWVQDIIFDSEAPSEANIDIAKYIQLGYVIGQCASSASVNNFVGLYKKISVS